MPVIPTNGSVRVDRLQALRDELAGVVPMTWDELKYLRLQVEDRGPVENTDSVVCRPGDLWVLGDHRLLCGDSTDPSNVSRLLLGAVPLIMITDPPYGVDYDPDWRNDAAQAGASSMGAPGGRALGIVYNDTRVDWTSAWMLFPGDIAYVWHAALHAGEVGDSLVRSGFMLRSQIVWAKSHIAISRGHYHWQHEPCWYAVRKGATSRWIGDRSQSTLWQIPKNRVSETGHSTQKPIPAMCRPIFNHDVDSVYDPFVGSGTTIIAAEQTRKKCFAMELNPEYVDVCLQRWSDYTKQDPVREDGAKFSELKVEAKRLGIGR